MKTLLITIIMSITTNVMAIDLNKLTSIEFSKSCNAQKIVKLIPSMETRIIMIDQAATNISLSIPVNPCFIQDVAKTQELNV